MPHLLQLLNGYGLIWIPAVAALATLTILVLRRSRVRWWALWVTGAAGVGVTLSILPTAAGTEITPSTEVWEGGEATGTFELIEWQSANSIESTLRASNGKPTLVEFYTDFGIG